jgi:threonylcarbamoyladenosine tRNA methylthiotransferase CDKAL1
VSAGVKRVYIETYGCASNLHDSQIMMGLLSSAGYMLVDSPAESDVNVINTCVVKTPTEHRMIQRIKTLSSSGKPLVVAGCMSKAEPEVVEKHAPTASLVSPRAISRIVDAVRSGLEGSRAVFLEDEGVEKVLLPHIRFNEVIEIVEISTGCLSSCAFCQTKLARGWLTSYRPGEIRRAVARAVNEGYREIWLTSQDSSAYGRDIGTSLPTLLESLIKHVPGKYFIRVGMMNPLHFKKVELESLVKAYSDDRLFKFLHLCVQSGSDNVLRDMRRGYRVRDFVSIVDSFRKAHPMLTLMTDIIVGYPTEDWEDFEMTCRLIEDVKPHFVNISRFYPRPGTQAAKLKQLQPRELNKRSKILTALCREISRGRMEEWIGWTGTVLIDEVGARGEALGRNYAYTPVAFPGTDADGLLGRFVEAEVVSAKTHCTIGAIRRVIG